MHCFSLREKGVRGENLSEAAYFLKIIVLKMV